MTQNPKDGNKHPRQRRKRAKKAPEPITEVQLCGMDAIFPGFAKWYHETHDEQGCKFAN